MSFLTKIPILITHKNYLNKSIIDHLKNTYKVSWNYRREPELVHIFKGEVRVWRINALKKYCEQNHLKFEIDNKFGKRSLDYRQEFYNFYKPLFKGYYLCAYCGLPVKGKLLQVDHIYPVAKVNQSYKLQQKLIRLGATSVNSYQNLAPSCKSCNNFKRAKLGLWISLGFFGRNSYRRLFLNFIELLIFILFLIICFY